MTYTELLSIFETLKEFRTILLGQKLRIYTDNENFTCNHFNIKTILRWRPILEEYCPDIENIKDEKKIVADTLLRFPFGVNQETTYKSTYQHEIVSEINYIEGIPEGNFPINLTLIQ